MNEYLEVYINTVQYLVFTRGKTISIAIPIPFVQNFGGDS